MLDNPVLDRQRLEIAAVDADHGRSGVHGPRQLGIVTNLEQGLDACLTRCISHDAGVVRAEGGLVHYEVSSDGVSFTELGAHEQSVVFESASALLMAQTYGQDLEGGVVSVDDFEVCVQ